MTRFRVFCAITLAAMLSSSMQPVTEATENGAPFPEPIVWDVSR
jgi:hypothetical protein